MSSPVYGVRSRPLGQTSYYQGPFELKAGDYVLVAAEQGSALGRVVSGPAELPEGRSDEDLPQILRQASPEDICQGEENDRLAAEATAFCRRCIRERRMDMKLVDVEVFFDRSKLIFYFTAPARIDFRDLVKDLVREYRARIELRQIGVRHETQMVGAVGNCGIVCCCRRYLRKFAPVTIRMAKEQNLFLNPAKISGICGRLLCCLAYEQENYDNFHRHCPRLGKRYQTDKGPMKVLRANLFRNSIAVLTESGEEQEIHLDEWQALSPFRPEAPQNAAAQGRQPARPPQGDGLLVVSVSPETVDSVDHDFAPEGAECAPAATGDTSAAGDPAQAGVGKPRRKRRRKPQTSEADQ